MRKSREFERKPRDRHLAEDLVGHLTHHPTSDEIGVGHRLFDGEYRTGWDSMFRQRFQSVRISGERLQPGFDERNELFLVPAASSRRGETWIVNQLWFAEGSTDVRPLAVQRQDDHIPLRAFEHSLWTRPIVMDAKAQWSVTALAGREHLHFN